MALSFAGVTLPLATPELLERLDEIHPQDFDDWSAWNFTGWDLNDLPTPSLPTNPPFAIGKLWWPTGACRPAWFHAVVNTAKLKEIRAAVGDPMQPKNLVMSDGRTGQTITAAMYLLPARPLNQLGHDGSDAWILTLTDIRFYFQWKRGNIATKPASWSTLFTDLSLILGITIAVDTIDPDYLQPSEKWIGFQRPTAAVLDAAATQIGHRVVFGLDGSIKTVQWQTAMTDCQGYLADVGPLLLSGGFLSDADIGRYVPEAVKTVFASGNAAGQFAPSPYLVKNALFDLQIPLYGSAHGLQGASGLVFADIAFDGSNAGDCARYASSAAFDWYGWRASDVDMVFPGIEPYQPTGWEDFIEWTYQRRETEPFASTRIRRGPWDDFVSGSWLPNTTSTVAETDTDCDPCGWLLDRVSLVTENKAFRVRIFQGAPGGRCECIENQGLDDDDPWLAIYDLEGGGLDKWVLSRNLTTCCACATLVFDVTPTSDIPATGTMTVTRSCQDDIGEYNPYTYDLKFQKCFQTVDADGTVHYFASFAAAGIDNCNSPPPYPCKNSFCVTIECVDCDLTNPACSSCQFGCGAPVWAVVAAGFSGTSTAYNSPPTPGGAWMLQSEGENTCLWSMTCDQNGEDILVTVIATVTTVGPNGKITVTFSGADGGTAVYSFTASGVLDCFSGYTLTRDSGDAGTTPATITVGSRFCERPVPCCPDIPVVHADITATGDCACFNGATATLNQVGGGSSWTADNLDSGGCGPTTSINLSCDYHCDNTVTLNVTVACGVSNIGTGSLVVPCNRLTPLHSTIPVIMTDSSEGSCTGDCNYQYIAMVPGWILLGNTCTGAGCNDCPNEPLNPPADPVDGQLYSEPCTGGVSCECCCGSISILFTEP